jgi:hypothetical protein
MGDTSAQAQCNSKCDNGCLTDFKHISTALEIMCSLTITLAPALVLKVCIGLAIMVVLARALTGALSLALAKLSAQSVFMIQLGSAHVKPAMSAA